MHNDELLYLVDDQDNILGSVWKSKAHGNPKLIHREIAVVIFNDKNEVLLQQRSEKKEYDPGQWKLAAAGHAEFNERMEDSAKREVYEELGINIEPIFYKKEYHTSESQSRFFWVYYSKITGRPNLKLQLDEVSKAEWIPMDELNDFAKDKPYFLESLSYKMITEIAKEIKMI